MRLLPTILILAISQAATAEVVIRGVGGDMAKTIKRFLSLGDDCSLPKWAVRYRYKQADNEIDRALQTFGYYSPRIDKSLSFDTDCWTAEFQIDAGEPVRLREININITGAGQDDKAFTNLLGNAPLKSGAIFDHERYENFKSSLEELAAERGYFNASFVEHQVRVSRANTSADVNLTFATGPRFSFGPVTFEDAPLTDQLMRRYVPFDQGDPYEAAKIGSFYQSLTNSEYFDDVIIDTTTDDASHRVPINVQLIPADPHTTRIGLGFSTDIGPKISASYKNIRLNQRGHRLDGSVSLAPVKQELGAAWRIPRKEHQSGWNTIYGGLTREDTDTSRSTRQTLGVRQTIPRRAGWLESRFIEMVDDDFKVAGESSDNFSIVPGIGWRHTSSDATARPPSGHSLELELSGTSEVFGSTTDYVHVVAKGKIIRPLWAGARVISRTRMGASFSDEFDRLPPSTRFFSGGDDRVRGFDFESIGPKDDRGKVVGGNRVLEASLEVDQLVHEDWAIAMFMDAGNATLDSFASDFETGAGIGLRWYSPLGPLRLDLAVPVDSERSGLRVHISFGPDI